MHTFQATHANGSGIGPVFCENFQEQHFKLYRKQRDSVALPLPDFK